MAARTIPRTRLNDLLDDQPAAVPQAAEDDERERASHIATSDENVLSVEFDQAEPGRRSRAAMGERGRSVRDDVDEYLLAIDGQVLGVQAATATYRGRPLEWVDVVTLRQVREHLSRALEGISSATAAADLKRTARQVAVELRRHRER